MMRGQKENFGRQIDPLRKRRVLTRCNQNLLGNAFMKGLGYLINTQTLKKCLKILFK